MARFIIASKMVHVTKIQLTTITHNVKMQAYAALIRRRGRSAAASTTARVLAGPVISSDYPQRRVRTYISCSSSHYLMTSSCSSLLTTSSLRPSSSSRFLSNHDLLTRTYTTLPSLTASSIYRPASNDDGITNRTSNLLSNKSTNTLIQKRSKVFVSKHNQTLNLTPSQITSYLCQQLPHLTPNSDDFRITSTHVVMKECPFCTKPTHDKADNLYKLYVKLGGGAYFCHRCGAKGSWYDLKSGLGGFSVENSGGGGGGYNHTHQQHSNHRNNHGNSYQPTPPQRAPQPLPMPHPKLNSLHSSRLFDPRNNSTSYNTNEYKAMQYLQQERGLTNSVLRKYGVGCATYKFASKKRGSGGMEYVESMCVTFPWLMRQGEVEEQEELRGAEYVWRRSEEEEEDIVDEEDGDKEKGRQRELERESKRRIQAVKEAEAAAKKNNKARSEMTALERYYAKRERKRALSLKKKATLNDDDEEVETNDNNNNTLEEFQFTPISQQHQQQVPTPLTSDEVESLHGPYITRRIKVRSITQKSWQRLDPAGGGFGLFGWHTIPHNATEIILTEGEFDAMAVFQATGRPAVSLPNGCRSLPMEVLVLLERFDTVYLWMDNDGPGREGAEMFARKLGVERCLLVQPSGKRGWIGDRGDCDDDECEDVEALLGLDDSRPPPPKDANEALLQGWDINELLNEASELPHERILKFSDLRDQVCMKDCCVACFTLVCRVLNSVIVYTSLQVIHEITNPDKYRGVPVPSLPGFTSLIKGFRRGEMTVLTGPTGSGKTTFLGQASLDLAEQGVNVLWGSFEIKNTRLMHKLLQQYMKDVLPIGLAEKEGSMEEKKKMYEALTVLADKFDTLPMYFMKFHGGSDIDDVLDAMEYAAYVHDVEHIILDNMQFMISRDVKKMSSSFDKFDMQDIAIEKFRKFATDYNVHGESLLLC